MYNTPCETIYIRPGGGGGGLTAGRIGSSAAAETLSVRISYNMCVYRRGLTLLCGGNGSM